jgi:CBS domain-containing protein
MPANGPVLRPRSRRGRARSGGAPVPVSLRAAGLDLDDDTRTYIRRRGAAQRRLFVQDRGRLVGVISQTDIAHAVGSGRLQAYWL